MSSRPSFRTLFSATKSVVIAAAIAALTAQSALACTGIVLRAQDGAIVPARTMEFGFNVESDVVAVPAGTTIETLPLRPDVTGFSYETKYGFVGLNALGMPIVLDGLNTEGLYYGAFYFAGLAEYEELTPENQGQAVSSEEMGNWVLGNFATVAEVRAALSDITVIGTFVDAIQTEAPVHYTVTDKSGASIVFEYTAAGLVVHENMVGVITNNPTYDWHMTNLRNYLGLRAENFTEMTVGGATLRPFGQGTGMLGLPGDFTSPTRFVRATAFVNTALPTANADEAIFQAFHILNAFDIPKGSITETVDDEVHTDYTVWTSASDLQNLRFYFKTYDTQAVQMVDVMGVLNRITEPTFIPMETGFSPVDRTEEF